MKKLFLLLIMLVFISVAEGAKEERSQLYSMIEPPMQLSEELPITLSQDNRQAFVANSELLEEEAERNVAFMKSKALPWLPLLAALVVSLAILFIRLLPSKGIEEKTDLQIKEKNDLEIKEALKKLFSTVPKDETETRNAILHTDFLLRYYLENHYGFPAFSCTIQELSDKIETLQDLTPEVKKGMYKIFQTADKIKFANYAPSPVDFQPIPGLL